MTWHILSNVTSKWRSVKWELCDTAYCLPPLLLQKLIHGEIWVSTSCQLHTTCVSFLLSCNRVPLQHIVDKEAILQLMKNCPMCDRKCRCTKHSRGPYFIVYQSCYFCHYQRKWASQPEALNMNINKAHTGPKKKHQPKEKLCVNAKAKSSKLKKLQKLTWPIRDLRSPVLSVAYMNLGHRTSFRCALKWSIIRLNA